MRGIVFEISGERAVVLKLGGEFVELRAKRGWQVGDVVALPAKKIRPAAIVALAASVALVFVSLFAALAVSQTGAALISIDVNPAIELTINKFGNVISAEARNEEGELLLELVQLKGMPYTQAVLRLMEADGLGQYLLGDGLMVFSVQADSAAFQTEILESLRSSADPYIETHHHGTLTQYYLVDGQLVEAAHRHGVTAGKYMLLLQLESLAPEIDIEYYAHHGVDDIQTEIEAHRNHGSNSGSGSSEHEGEAHDPVEPPQPDPETPTQGGSSGAGHGHEEGGHGNSHGGH